VHLLDLIETTRGDGAPFVLGGDFNAEPSRPEFRLMQPLRDVVATVNPEATGPTWGVSYDGLPGRRIDFLFDATDPRLVPVEAGVTLNRPDAAGRYPSDHFGVYARYVFQ